ncbi:hypothetical protein BV20DRAFT_140307 [Pilatotrama ljubarskyi]|nr:hypothetical protein BV20DRAFT_140307 [Pilatotrama ljubarskyi]
MAALAFPDVIADITSLLLALQANFQPKTASTPELMPLPIVAPAPQRPAADFATVLGWREPEHEPQGRATSPTHPINDGYLRSGGLYTQRVLARGRLVAAYAAQCEYAHAMNVPALVNQAPPWPPAPELIANPPDWGHPLPGETVAPQWYAPEVTYTDATERIEGYDEALTAGSEPTSLASQSTRDGREERWDAASSQTSVASDASYEECATGYFVGRDGTVWPLPPHECMPGSHPSPYELLLDATKPRQSQACSPMVLDASLDAGPVALEVLGVEAGTLPSPSVAALHVQDSLEAGGPWSGSRPGSQESSSSVASSEPPVTPSSGAAMSVPSLADLGRQWYDSFGKDLHAVLSNPQTGLRSCSSTEMAEGLLDPVRDFIQVEEVFFPPPYKRETESPRIPDVQAQCTLMDAYVLGRNGCLWPYPPPPPVPYIL